jgi:hypothetical protein
MSKFNFRNSVNFNKPISVNQLAKKIGVNNKSKSSLKHAHNVIQTLDSEKFQDLWVSQLTDIRFYEVMEFHRKHILNDCVKMEKQTDYSKRFIKEFSAPILRSEMFSVQMFIQMGLWEKDENMLELIETSHRNPLDGVNRIMSIISSIRNDKQMLNSLMSMENIINWDDEN